MCLLLLLQQFLSQDTINGPMVRLTVSFLTHLRTSALISPHSFPAYFENLESISARVSNIVAHAFMALASNIQVQVKGFAPANTLTGVDSRYLHPCCLSKRFA